MSKKINVRTISAEALKVLSDYNVAYKAIIAIKARYKALIDVAEKELSDIIAKRGEMRQQGKTDAEILEALPTVEAENKIRQLSDARTAELKPHNETITACAKTLPDYLFGAYAYAMEKGINAPVPKKGTTVTVGNSSYFVEKSFTAYIVDVCKEWGLGHADDEKACAKFGDIIKGRIAGMKKDTKGNYLTLKGQRTLNEMFLLAFIQYTIQEGTIAPNEDNTLSVVSSK